MKKMDGKYQYSDAQWKTLRAIADDANQEISRALARAGIAVGYGYGIRNADSVAGAIKDKQASDISDIPDLINIHFTAKSEAMVDKITDALKDLWPQKNIFRRDVPGDKSDFRCNDLYLRYPRTVPEGKAAHVGIGIRIESVAFQEYRETIERDRTEARQILEEEAVAQKIAKEIKRGSRGAPIFVVQSGKLKHQPDAAVDAIAERKSIAKECCRTLQALCTTRSNEQPLLAEIVRRYASALRNLRRDRGAYRLLVTGLELESLVNIKANAPIDPERNPYLDADLLHSIDALVIAHAGLMALFPETSKATRDVDRYRENTDAINALRSRVLDPVLRKLSEQGSLLDDASRETTEALTDLGGSAASAVPLRGETGAKHYWLRGILSKIGSYLLEQGRAAGKIARDTAVRGALTAAARHSGSLTTAIMRFLTEARDALIALGSSLGSSFGWLHSLLNFFDIL